MINDCRRYYQIVGGDAKRIYDASETARLKQGRAVKRFLKRHGGKEAWGYTSAVFGIVTDGHIPAGWRQSRQRRTSKGWLEPDKRTPEGKAIAADVEKINKLWSYSLTAVQFFNGSDTHVIDGRFWFEPEYGTLWEGSPIFVTIHKKCKIKPVSGLKPMKLSRIFAMREKAEAKKGK